MKKVLSVFLSLVFLSFPCFGNKLPSGRTVPVRLTSSISSNNRSEQQIHAIVDRDVKDANTDATLISRGTPVLLSAIIKRAKGIGKPAAITLTCVSTTAVDGQEISLQGSYTTTGESKKGLSLGLGIGLGIFLWPALFCLCIKGEKINLPTDMQIHNVVVNDDYIIVI